MNRTDIANQVSLTLGGYDEDFDMDAILDDLAEAGVKSSIDDIDSDTYWTIIKRHDTTVQTAAMEAHAAYLKAEAAYKQAITNRQIEFAKVLDFMGRGGNAYLSHKLGLAPSTIKGIADRGRKLLADPSRVRALEDDAV